MLDIFQSRAGERARANSLQPMAKRRLAPADELGAADAVCGFAPRNSIPKATGISSATASGSHNPSIWEQIEENYRMRSEKKHGRKD
jgi:hypothetical protein